MAAETKFSDNTFALLAFSAMPSKHNAASLDKLAVLYVKSLLFLTTSWIFGTAWVIKDYSSSTKNSRSCKEEQRLNIQDS